MDMNDSNLNVGLLVTWQPTTGQHFEFSETKLKLPKGMLVLKRHAAYYFELKIVGGQRILV